MTDQEFKQGLRDWSKQNPDSVLDTSSFTDHQFRLLGEVSSELDSDLDYPEWYLFDGDENEE